MEGFLDMYIYHEISAVISKYFPFPILHENDIDVLVTFITNDKKNHENSVYISLLKKIGVPNTSHISLDIKKIKYYFSAIKERL